MASDEELAVQSETQYFHPEYTVLPEPYFNLPDLQYPILKMKSFFVNSRPLVDQNEHFLIDFGRPVIFRF
jgi:hypothetical protein